MFKKILVPVDGSDASARGLDEAIKLAKSHGSQLRLLHVVNELVLVSPLGPTLYFPDLIQSLRDGGRNILETALKQAREQALDAETVMEEILGGRAANAIVEQAKRWPADVIVMGTHGRRGFGRMALGSDAEIVLRHTHVPVLLVRMPDSGNR